uniref:Uncharacterized protein n=1 Tax=Timema cristinae TaxID=61476 RepID=A0A7R9H6X5_TIMCR|nr:unnamed protein product [Timema cristinae]
MKCMKKINQNANKTVRVPRQKRKRARQLRVVINPFQIAQVTTNLTTWVELTTIVLCAKGGPKCVGYMKTIGGGIFTRIVWHLTRIVWHLTRIVWHLTRILPSLHATWTVLIAASSVTVILGPRGACSPGQPVTSCMSNSVTSSRRDVRLCEVDCGPAQQTNIERALKWGIRHVFCVDPRYPHEVDPRYPHEVDPRYPHEVNPRYPHEVDPRYPHEVKLFGALISGENSSAHEPHMHLCCSMFKHQLEAFSAHNIAVDVDCDRTLQYPTQMIQYRGLLRAQVRIVSAQRTVDVDLNLDLPIIGSPIYCKSDALDHAATKAVPLVRTAVHTQEVPSATHLAREVTFFLSTASDPTAPSCSKGTLSEDARLVLVVNIAGDTQVKYSANLSA